MNRFRTTLYFCFLSIVLAVGNLFAYEVSVGQGTVLAGNTVNVPLLLDSAADVATVQAQINYDPQLLTLISVTNAPATLGAQFTLDYEDDDGMLVVVLYREDSLLSGSGELVSMAFEVNPGAELQMESALVLAEASLGNQIGKDLSWSSSVTMSHGLLQVMPDENVDSDSDGIPDVWELLYSAGVTNMVASSDEDGDGFNNLLEYIAGTVPTDPASVFAVDLQINNPHNSLIWPGVSGRVYSVWSTTNLLNGFSPVATNIPWTANSYTNITVDPSGYYKVDVKLEE